MSSCPELLHPNLIYDAPRGRCNPASEDYDIMSLSVEMSGENAANLPAATGKNDTQGCCHGDSGKDDISHFILLRHS